MNLLMSETAGRKFIYRKLLNKCFSAELASGWWNLFCNDPTGGAGAIPGA
jgi:hypothetical protein